MITKVNEGSIFPADSFVNVACVLQNQNDVSEEYDYGIVSELTECKQENFIIEHKDSVAVSYSSFDVEAIDDIKDSIKKKDLVIRFLIGIFLVMTGVSVHLLREVLQGKRVVRELELKLNEYRDQLNKVNLKLNDKGDVYEIFDLSNCYFNFKASASIGACGEEYTKTINTWYEWGSEHIQGAFSSLFEEMHDHKEIEESIVESQMQSTSSWSTWTFENLSTYLATGSKNDSNWLNAVDLED